MTKNELTGVISLILGLFYLVITLRLPTVMVGDQVGPKVFPGIVATIAIVCGMILFITERFQTKSSKEKFSWDFTRQKDVYIRIVMTIATGLLYGFILDSLGYIISTTVFMLLVMFIINSSKRLVENIGISLLFSVTTYVIFAILLKLSLPRGILSF